MSPENSRITRAVLFVTGIVLLLAPLLKDVRNKGIIDSNLFSLLPGHAGKTGSAEQEEIVQNEFERKIVYLFVSADREKSVAAAQVMKAALESDRAVEILEYVGSQNAIETEIDKYPFLIQEQDLRSLENPSRLSGELWSRWNGISPLGPTIKDLLGIGGEIARTRFQRIKARFIQSAGFVIFENHNRYATLLLLNSRTNVFQMSAQDQLHERLIQYERDVVARVGNIEILKSGTLFHSVKAAARSKGEIGMMSTVSFLGVLVLILLVFGTLKPFIVTAVVAVIASAVAASVCVYIFGKIHLVTLVFGTSLIGISDDYSLHYFCQRYGLKKWTPWEAVFRIRPSLTMGLATTVVGFLGLIITPLPALRQIAVFCCVGLAVSYAFVILIYPYVTKTWDKEPSSKPIDWAETYLKFWDRLKYRNVFIGVALVVMLAGATQLKSIDDVRSFQAPDKDLLEMDRSVRNWIGMEPSSQYVLVSGRSTQEVLENQGNMKASLDAMVAEGNLSSYEMMAGSVPGIKMQQRSYDLFMKFLKQNSQELRRVFGQMGFPPETVPNYIAYIQSLQGKWISEDSLPGDNPLTPVNANGVFTGLVRLFGLRNSEVTASHLQGQNIHYVDRIAEISKLLHGYRTLIVWYTLISFVVIAILVGFRYRAKDVLRICGPPMIAGIVAVSVQGFWREGYTLFHVLAILLVLTLGIDFTIFMRESATRSISTMAAVSMSVITTILSFGLLGFSHTSMIRDFGITILFGSVCSVLLAPYARNRTP